MSSNKRARSSSPSTIHPASANKKRRSDPDFVVFAEELKKVVNKMLPTGGRRYDRAAILAITFSVSDIAGVERLRNQLLGIFKTTYKWNVEQHVINCNDKFKKATFDLGLAVLKFIGKHSSSDDSKSLVVFYFSGHGFPGDGKTGKIDELQICGSFSYPKGPKGGSPTPNGPYFSWEELRLGQKLLGEDANTHRLAIMDCCASGLANLEEDNVEVLGASSWESIAAENPQASFTRALIEELRKLNGGPIASTQLISALHSRDTVRKGVSMPIHKREKTDSGPAIIHRIETTPPPQKQITTVPRYSHVTITVKVSKENTVPNAVEWGKWLKTNLPHYVGDIDIVAKWKTSSALVVVVLPIEIWLGLPNNPAYTFMDFHRAWDAQAARQRLEAVTTPQQPQQLALRQPGMRSGNIPPSPHSGPAGKQ